MKLVHSEISNIMQFDEEFIQILSIENKDYFLKLLGELCSQNDGGAGRFILSNAEGEISIEKEIVIIHSPFITDFSDKRLYKALYKDLESIALGEDYYLQTQIILSQIGQWLTNISDDIQYELDVPDEYDLQYLIRYSGVKFFEKHGNIEEKITDYILLLNDVLKIKLFVLVNFHSYFSGIILEQMYETFMLKKVPILLFESNVYDTILSREKVLIIDEDLCEITK